MYYTVSLLCRVFNTDTRTL